MLWCLLFVVVLTMISGARELMTPGAWKRDGLTYLLRADESADESGEVTKEGLAERHVRRDTLMRLYRDLSVFAAAHAGRFPTIEELADLPIAALGVPHLANLKYGYVPRRTAGSESKLLAFEPVAYGDQAWGLFTDGEARQLSIDELRRLTAEEAE